MIASLPLVGRFALGFALSALLGWVALRWLGPKGFMDLPDERKHHKGAVPRTGGVALVVTLLVGFVARCCALPFTWVEWVGLLAMATVGFIDDRYTLRARWKAIVGLVAAVTLAAVGAGQLLGLGVDLRVLGLELPTSFGVYFSLLMLFYWCVPQSFNLIDGMNGLALGYAMVVLGSLGLAGHVHPFTLGAVGGVLIWNFPKARHFLGDCGSMALGLLLALLAKQYFAGVDPNKILWVFAYPFLDTTMVVLLRLAKGENPANADRSHLHHRWQEVLRGRECWVTPILLVHAAACASAVYVQGWGWWVPGLGLISLASQVIWFALRDLMQPRRLTAKPSRPAGQARLVVSD